MSGALPVARQVRAAGDGPAPADRVRLTHDERLLRRRRLTTDGGRAFLVDLASVTDLGPGDLLLLDDGSSVAVEAAEGPLMEATGPDLARLAWHVGNRHAPCQIEPRRLILQREAVMRDMLVRLGAEVRDVVATFHPEGGAYGHGRTMGHEHGHVHSHDTGGPAGPGPDHSHDHAPPHGPAGAG